MHRGAKAERIAGRRQPIRSSAYHSIELTDVEADVSIVLSTQLEKTESILVCCEAPVHAFVQKDQAAFDDEDCDHLDIDATRIPKRISRLPNTRFTVC